MTATASGCAAGMEAGTPDSGSSARSMFFHHVALTVGALALFVGAAAIGQAPSSLVAVENPDRWFAGSAVSLALGVAALLVARRLQPWRQPPGWGLVGGWLGWLAWGFGAALLGAGGGWFGIGILALGAWVQRQRYRRQRAEWEAGRSAAGGADTRG